MTSRSTSAIQGAHTPGAALPARGPHPTRSPHDIQGPGDAEASRSTRAPHLPHPDGAARAPVGPSGQGRVGVVPGSADPPGASLKTTRFGALVLPSGIELAGLEVAYTLQGRPAPDGSNLILAFHSLTGRPDPRTWWPGLFGKGRVLDPARWAILAPAFVGSPFGTRVIDGAGRPFEEAIPTGITTRDQAFLVELLLDRLGISRARLAVGASFGGMVALEWAALAPGRTDTVVSVAAPGRQTAEALANHHLQREAIRLLPPPEGMALARKVAMTTYRSGEEFESRFGRRRRSDGLPEVASWLDHHGRKLSGTFPAAHYRALLETMDRHDVGRDREGGIGGALARFRGRLVGVGIPGDRLYPASEVKRWVDAARAARKRTAPAGPPIEYREIRSIHGHDAFLLEEERVREILAEVLSDPLTEPSTPSPETSTPPTETSTPSPETSTPPTETSTPPTETSTPPTETSTRPTETSTPPAGSFTLPAPRVADRSRS